MFIVEFYETKDGKSPVYDYLISLEKSVRAKAAAMIGVLQEKGIDLRYPYTTHLRNGIFELRIIHGNNISRLLFFYTAGKRIIVTNGFTKKQQKTPAKVIRLAETRRAEYLRRHPEER